MRDVARHTPEQLEAALRASEARFRNIIEKNADGMVVVSRGGVIRFMNPAAECLLGCKAPDCAGTLFGIPLVPNERTEIDLPRSDRSGAVAEMRATETEWEGEPAYLATLRDVTERKQMEEELRRQTEALAEADRRKDQFLATLAHELRNPLAPICTGLEVMRRAEADCETVRRVREMAERQVGQLTRLVDDLLDVARITRDKIMLRKERVELTKVLIEAVETSRPLIEAASHQLTVTLPKEPVWLDADATRLAQVVSNLLNNAAKYTPGRGHVWLTAEREPAGIVIKVRDTGDGIPADMLPRVFDLFTQVDRSLERRQGGLGIGLTLVKRLVEMHGGTVEAHSAGPDRGSEFVVRLPVASARARDEVVNGEEGQRTASPARRVLVVDDNGDAADSLALLLRMMGHDVRTAHDGLEAIEAATSHRPDLVLLDIGLPGLNGYEVARRLRGQAELRGVLLVAVTGWGQEEDRRRAHESGFNHHLTKPADLAALERLLASLPREQ